VKLFLRAIKNNIMEKFERKLLSPVISHLSKKELTIITGARQTGKTTILEQIYSHLTKKKETVAMISLEDISVLAILNQHPENIFQFVQKPETGKLYLLIDEIQYLENPSNFLKLLFDKYHSVLKLVVTGSSAFYIDERFKDSLAGRKKLFILQTLDFEEYLLFRAESDLLPEWQEIRNNSRYISLHRNKIQLLFDDYLTFGGYPNVVLQNSREEKIEALQELFHSYLKRDVMEAGILHKEKFYKMLTILTHQTGGLLNMNELANTLMISVPAVDNYIHVLQKCFHIGLLKPFHRNIRKELTKMPKIYFNDLGFRNVIIKQFGNIGLRPDKGELVENYVYIRLSQKYSFDNLRFWRTSAGNEVDFVVNSEDNNSFAIEVKYSTKEFNEKKYKMFKESYPEIPLQPIAYMSDDNSTSLLGL